MIYSQSELSRATGCTRQNISAAVKSGHLVKTPDGKIDTENSANRFWIESRTVNASKIQTPPGPRPTKPKKPKAEKPHLPTYAESGYSAPNPDDYELDPDDTNSATGDVVSLAEKKMRLEVEKLEEQRDKLKIENQKARAELVEREILSDALFGYLVALNKNILSMPRSYIDEIEAALKMGKSKIEASDILTRAIGHEITVTKDQIKREIERYRRASKHNAPEKQAESE